MKPRVQYSGYEGVLYYGRYGNGRMALMLIDELENEPIAVISVNLPDTPMDDDEMAIKTYSENEGILDAIQPLGILKEWVQDVPSGFVTIPVYKVDLDRIMEIGRPLDR